MALEHDKWRFQRGEFARLGCWNMSIVALENGKWRLQHDEFDTKSQNNVAHFFPSQVSAFPKNNEK